MAEYVWTAADGLEELIRELDSINERENTLREERYSLVDKILSYPEGDSDIAKQTRRRIREAGEPCGWVCGRVEHQEYRNLPERQKYLMMLENEREVRNRMREQ